MSTEIRAEVSPGEVRVAVVTNGILQEFGIWRPGKPDGVDDLYCGRVRAAAPSLAGCFVDLSGEEGFLPDSEGAKGLTEGDSIGVRVTRAAQAGKGARLTARGVTIAEGPVGLAVRGPGTLREFAALYPDAKILIDNAALCAALRPEFFTRLKLVQQAFDGELGPEVEGLFETNVPLPGGAEIFIEPTRALVAIDVDSGLGGGRAGRLSSHMAANRAMLPELARQIRLRDLAGLIMVDFAGLPPGRRISLAPELSALLAKDPRAPRLVGFTGLGLAEILRTRRHPPLHELVQGPHAAGLRALREAALHPRARLRLRALPAIVAALESDPVALRALAHDTTYPLELISAPGLPAPGYVIEDAE